MLVTINDIKRVPDMPGVRHPDETWGTVTVDTATASFPLEFMWDGTDVSLAVDGDFFDFDDDNEVYVSRRGSVTMGEAEHEEAEQILKEGLRGIWHAANNALQAVWNEVWIDATNDAIVTVRANA